jgi:hypothetical protein
MHHVGFGRSGRESGRGSGRRGGGGVFGGVFDGVFGGGLGGVVGGEGVADKEERGGGGLHPDKEDPITDLTPSVVKFVLSCLVTCTGAARATREAPAAKTKGRNLESARKMPT